MDENWVAYPPVGLVIALQYWAGDEEQAMRLARLLADIEPSRRKNVTLALCRRFDCELSKLSADTWSHCIQKFNTIAVQSKRKGTGHPAGPNELMAGTMDILARAWWRGNLDAESVFLIEPDGVPLRRDWIDRLQHEHHLSLRAGRRVTGALTEGDGNYGWLPHFNGSMLIHFSAWIDRISIRRTPPTQAWDVFHAAAYLQEGRATSHIKNVYGGTGWSKASLRGMSKETAWLSSTKDTTALAWAEQELAAIPYHDHEFVPFDVDRGSHPWSTCKECSGAKGNHKGQREPPEWATRREK